MYTISHRSRYRQRLASISSWVAETNKELGSSVAIGGILLDCEQYQIDQSNLTQQLALARKHDLYYNVSREYCPKERGCVVEQ